MRRVIKTHGTERDLTEAAEAEEELAARRARKGGWPPRRPAE
ncbi:hypothetical protein ACIPXV_02920 [Streptomyces libani]